MKGAKLVSPEDGVALIQLIDELTSRLRDHPGMNPAVWEILCAALRKACKQTGLPFPDLRSEKFIRAQEARHRAAVETAIREALTGFVSDALQDKYRCDHLVEDLDGETFVLARGTEVYAQYVSPRRIGITHRRFTQFMRERALILDRVGERGINGRRVGHLLIFRVARINALAGVSLTAPVAPQQPGVDPAEVEEVEALATVLKTYFKSPYKGQHFTAKLKRRQCLLATAEHVHEFCQGHHATMEIASHRLGPRSLKAAARRHGLLVDDNYWLRRDGKLYGHLLAFDVELVKDFYGRHAPATG